MIWPLLDLKQELEAELSHRLGLSGDFDAERAAREAARRGVSEQRVKALLGQLAALASRAENENDKPLVTAAELNSMVREAEQLLSQLGSE